jgi:hypothetical protein
MANDSDRAELSTLQSQLDDVTRRVVAVSDGYRDTPDSAIVAELDTAERSLLAARRAIDRVVKFL